MFPDGHFRRVIFKLGPYIADYPEQVLLACVLQGWCARYVHLTAHPLSIQIYDRCLSPPSNLDAITGDRCRQHVDLAVKVNTKAKLGKSYGIIKQLVVRYSWFYFRNS